MNQHRHRVVTTSSSQQKRLKKTLSELPCIQERIIVSARISKLPKESLGITIVGGADTHAREVYVKAIDACGVCAIKNGLKVGDQILMVNDRSFRGATHSQAVEYLKRGKSEVKFIVSRMIEKKTEKVNSPLTKFQEYQLCTSPYTIEEPLVLEHKRLLPRVDSFESGY